MAPKSTFKASKSSSESAAWPTQSDFTSVSLFPAGSSIQIRDGSFVQYNNVTKTEVLNPLYDRVSPNAILNKGGRADAVRCHPGTREEVIARIEKWHRANHLDGHPIFWLSGPAGAGKSAIVQTIAERCIIHEVPMVNFFFFRADATRNDAGPVVATLLFQLFELVPGLKAHVMDIAINNPVIFRQSMEDQFSILIEKPLRAIRKISGQSPLVVLINGLDECSSEHGKAEQSSLLRILHDITTKVNPAFIALVASRNEAHLTMTFNEIGTSPDSIYLDESYRPFDDIRLFLSAEFSRIRRTHSLRNSLDANWPLQADIDSISHKSSGQFVYAATVMRFIATSPASPKRSLEIVLGLRPVTKISPFATLDSLYSYILSQAEDWESVQDIIAADKLLTDSRFKLAIKPVDLPFVLVPLGYTLDDILSSLSELAAIIQFHSPVDSSVNSRLTVFHASLADFLYDENRAGKFYIDMNAFACRLALLHLKQAADSGSLYYSFQFLSVVTEPNQILDEFLNSYLPNPDTFIYKHNVYLDRLLAEKEEWIDILPTLYQSRDRQLHKNVTTRWEEWFAILEYAQEAHLGHTKRKKKAISIGGGNIPVDR